MKHTRTYQKGVMLLEALIGLLIFSIGILALIAMQSVAIAQVRDAKYRVEASELTERMLGNLYILGSPTATGATAVISAWQANVSTTLPSGAGTVTAGANGQVTITVTWQAPAAAAASNHTSIAVIKFN